MVVPRHVLVELNSVVTQDGSKYRMRAVVGGHATDRCRRTVCRRPASSPINPRHAVPSTACRPRAQGAHFDLRLSIWKQLVKSSFRRQRVPFSEMGAEVRELHG